MKKSMLVHLGKVFAITIAVMTLVFSVNYFVLAFAEPAQAPPQGNAPAPLNVSGTEQTKTGNLGIGATPSERLEISGSSSSTIGRLRITDTDASDNPEWQLKYGTGANDHWATYVDKGDSSKLKFWNGDNRLTIDTAGNVGIGTTSPTAVLHLKAGTTVASAAPLKFISGALLATPEAGAVEFLGDAFYGTIATGAVRKTFAFTDSNITGNAATATALAADPADCALGNFATGIAASGNLTCAAPVGTIDGSGAAGAVTFWQDANTIVADSSNLFWDDTQNRLGIGVSSPQDKLHVSGNIRVTGNISGAVDDRLNIYHNTSATDSRSWIELWGDDSASGHSSRTGELTLAGTYIDFRYNSTDSTSGDRGMRLDSKGNLGIATGTSRLYERFQIGSSNPLTYHAGGNKAISFNAEWGDLNAGLWSRIGEASAFSLYWDTGADSLLLKAALSGVAGSAITWTNALTIKSDGNVGIGTTSPDFKLDVVGDVRIEQSNKLLFGGTVSSDAKAQIYWDGNRLVIQVIAPP